MAANQQRQMTKADANEATVKNLPAVQPETAMEFVPFMADAPIKLSVAIVQRYLAKPTASGQVCTVEQATKFMMLCRARKLNPFEGDAFIVGFDSKGGPEFNLITAHQAFLKRAEVHPEYDGMESGVIVEDKDGQMVNRVGDFVHKTDTLLGGWAIVHFKNRKVPTERRLNLEVFNQHRSRWNVDPAGQIVKCAEADALRSSFPTMLGGMYLEDEFLPTIIDAQVKNVAEATPLPAQLDGTTSSERLSNKLGGKKAKQQQESPADEQTGDPDPKGMIKEDYAACETSAEVESMYTHHCGPEGVLTSTELKQYSVECRDARLKELLGVE